MMLLVYTDQTLERQEGGQRPFVSDIYTQNNRMGIRVILHM